MTKADLTAEIKRAAVRAVVDGLAPQDALAAVIAVVAWMVGGVPDPAKRQEHLDHVMAMLPRAVAYVSAGVPIDGECRRLQ
jgi:hypothetical protein